MFTATNIRGDETFANVAKISRLEIFLFCLVFIIFFFWRGDGKLFSLMFMKNIYCFKSLEQLIAFGQSGDCQGLIPLVIFSNFTLNMYKSLIAIVTLNHYICNNMFYSHNLHVHTCNTCIKLRICDMQSQSILKLNMNKFCTNSSLKYIENRY